jgi:HPt (histidine-containing phosphotransfer) domain-containing protein
MNRKERAEDLSPETREQLKNSLNELAAEMELTGGGRRFLSELGAELLRKAPSLLAEIRRAIEAQQPAKLCAPAKELRRALAGVGVSLIASLLTQVEAYASADDFTGALARLVVVEKYYAILSDELVEWIRKNG